MIELSTWKKAWALFDKRERRAAILTILVVIIAAIFGAGMVGAIIPFLSVLGDPSKIQSQPQLNWAYEAFGFTGTYRFVVWLGMATAAVIFAASFVQVLRVYVVARFAMMRTHTLSHKLLKSYLRQSYTYFLDHHSGDIGTKILSESQQVVSQFFRPAANAIASFFSIIAILCLLFWYEPIVTGICFFALASIYGVALILSKRKLAQLGDLRIATNIERFRLATEVLGGIKEIKLLGREVSYLKQYEHPSRTMAWTRVVASVVSEVPSHVLQGIAFGGIIILILVLMDPEGIETDSTLGNILPLLGVFAFAGQRLIPELQRLYNGLTQMQYGNAAVNAVYEDLLNHETGGELPEIPPEPLGFKDVIELDSVSYRYPNADSDGLRDITIRIKAGEKIGVVGGTGAGKTTLADLLLGLLQPTKGAFQVDGVDITKVNLRCWQQTVGYVPQSIFLIDATIKENVALGIPTNEIDMNRVRQACSDASLSNFVEFELPLAYETYVGERGVRLSGGQRQRIGIARALYHDADFFVFDEATSALDNLTEREVISAINAMPGDKTILMIAHRLSTVESCDRILVLENGEISGFGAWNELIKNNQVFQKFVGRREAADDGAPTQSSVGQLRRH